MSKTLEEQMEEAVGYAYAYDSYNAQNWEMVVTDEAVEQCVKVAQIYALEQQIGTLMRLRAAFLYKYKKVSYLLDDKLTELESQLKVLKDG